MNKFKKYPVALATEEALKQIEDMKYRSELIEKNINNILELAIVFKGKDVRVTKRLGNQDGIREI